MDDIEKAKFFIDYNDSSILQQKYIKQQKTTSNKNYKKKKNKKKKKKKITIKQTLIIQYGMKI